MNAQNAHESFFGHFTALVKEARDAVGDAGKVDDPREFRFDIEFADRRYAMQGYPDQQRVFVGQYLGDRGVVWFDELRFDELSHGWRNGGLPAYDFVRGLTTKSSLSTAEIDAARRARAQSSLKETPTSVERRAEASAGRRAAARRAPERRGAERSQSAKPVSEARWWTLAKTVYQTYRSAQAHMPHPLRSIRRTAGRILRAR